MNQDVGNTEDLSELVQQMLKRMQNGFEVMGKNRVHHVMEISQQIDELEARIN